MALREQGVALGVGRIPRPAFDGKGHRGDLHACGMLNAEDRAPRGADHGPQLGVQQVEGLSVDAQAYVYGHACIHAHLHVWWRLADDADLGTAYLCARFDRGSGCGDFGADELEETGWYDAEFALEDAPGGNLDARCVGRSVLVEVGRRLEPQEWRSFAGRFPFDSVRLGFLDCCEYGATDPLGWGEPFHRPVAVDDLGVPLLPAFVRRECGVFKTQIRIVPEDHLADEIVQCGPRVVDKVRLSR